MTTPGDWRKEIHNKITRKSAEAIDHEIGSGNVHADLGFTDAAEMMAKARMASQISCIIQARKITWAKASELLGL